MLGLRSFPFGRCYVVFCFALTDGIGMDVVCVLHGSRDLDLGLNG